MSAMYMKVTKDRYEFPLLIADSVDELANIAGVHRTTIFRDIKRKGSGFVKVEVSNDEDLSLIRDEIANKGVEHFEKAKKEFAINGKTEEYKYLLGIAEGLRMAMTIMFGKKV